MIGFTKNYLGTKYIAGGHNFSTANVLLSALILLRVVVLAPYWLLAKLLDETIALQVVPLSPLVLLRH